MIFDCNKNNGFFKWLILRVSHYPDHCIFSEYRTDLISVIHIFRKLSCEILVGLTSPSYYLLQIRNLPPRPGENCFLKYDTKDNLRFWEKTYHLVKTRKLDFVIINKKKGLSKQTTQWNKKKTKNSMNTKVLLKN